MEGNELLEELKAAWEEDREPACPRCGQKLGELCLSCLFRELGDFLPSEEVQDWCVDWLLSCPDDNVLAKFIVTAMGRRNGLADELRGLIARFEGGGSEPGASCEGCP